MTQTFAQFGFKPFIDAALKEIGFKEPTEVQARLIPLILKRRSVVGQSQTGSGKTHTFLLPIFQTIDPELTEVQAVITTPSRELAYQIYDAAKQIAKHSEKEILVHNYVGGTDKQRQIEKLEHRQPQIVIGTPGRVLDLMKSQALDVHNASVLVVDEADMTLDLGFLKETDAIASAMPKELQMMVFSATIPDKLKPFLRKYMTDPIVEVVENKNVISPTIDNWLISTKGRDRNQLIYQLLTMGQPYLALVFANTKERVDDLTRYLRSQGLRVAKIHGGIPPRERKRTMREIQNMEYQFVVATDLAARGIDIEGVSQVINDDIPEDLEFFIHRVGRTGRNGMEGTAITLYAPSEDKMIAELENLGISFEEKKLSNGELVASYDRNRRFKRRTRSNKLDPKIVGMAIKTRLNAQSSVMSSKSAKLRADRKCAMPERETGSFKRYLTFWRIFSIL